MQSAGAVDHPRLTILRQPLTFTAERAGQLPDWLGSAWRGALGRELKSLVCVTGLRGCAPCALYRQCPYPRIFETPPDPAAGKMRKYTDAPRPYVLLPSAGGAIRAGQALRLEVRLFGRDIKHRALMMDALARAATRGLGRDQLPLRLDHIGAATTDVFEGQEATATAPSATLQIELLSPLRLRVSGKPAGPDTLQFGDFFSALLRRISMLCTFHEQAFDTDFRALVAQARSVRWLHHELRRAPLKRYSNRQQRAIDLSGLVGSLCVPAAEIQALLPYLYLGQHTLVGRGAVMGLGEYRIQTNA